MTPTVFIQFVSKFLAITDVMVFFHLRPLSTPSVPPENRYTVTRTIIPNCYRLVIRHGYTDEVVTEDLGMLVYEQLRNFIIREEATPRTHATHTSESTSDEKATSSTSASSAEANDTVSERLAGVQKAYDTQVLYIVGKEQMRIMSSTRIWRRVVLKAFLWLRDNTRSKMASMRIPIDQLVEVGFIKEV